MTRVTLQYDDWSGASEFWYVRGNWLDIRKVDWRIDIDMSKTGLTVHYDIADPRMAILFKLTFGGHA